MAELTGASRLTLSKEQVWSRLGEEIVILDLKSSAYLGLENLGARIWELLAQPTTVSEIEHAIVAEYDVSAEQCHRGVRGLLEALVERGLVLVDAKEA